MSGRMRLPCYLEHGPVVGLWFMLFPTFKKQTNKLTNQRRVWPQDILLHFLCSYANINERKWLRSEGAAILILLPLNKQNIKFIE